MRSVIVIGTLAIVLSQSAISGAETQRPSTTRLTPVQAVINAAEMPNGIGGVFEMVVRAAGRQGPFLYLNSEADYRDPRNLSIAIAPAEQRALAERVGGPLETTMLRKTIAVRGIARKTKIDFIADGRPTGKYYFQTHLKLASARDLTVEGERPIP